MSVEPCYVQSISSSSFSQRLEQVHDQGMRDGKGFILSGFHNITGRMVRRKRTGEWRQNASKAQ